MRQLALGFIAALTTATAVVAQAPDQPKEKAPKKDASVIAAWEIEKVESLVTNAYDVVQLLRPRFFQVRSKSNISLNPLWGDGPGVLIDEAPRGGLETLRGIPVTSIREIRYVSGPDAASRYGVEFHAGAILVITK